MHYISFSFQEDESFKDHGTLCYLFSPRNGSTDYYRPKGCRKGGLEQPSCPVWRTALKATCVLKGRFVRSLTENGPARLSYFDFSDVFLSLTKHVGENALGEMQKDRNATGCLCANDNAERPCVRPVMLTTSNSNSFSLEKRKPRFIKSHKKFALRRPFSKIVGRL